MLTLTHNFKKSVNFYTSMCVVVGEQAVHFEKDHDLLTFNMITL